MDRRDFLKTVAITGAALSIQHSEAMEILTQTINNTNGGNPDLVAVMGGEPEAMFRRAISELGGMKQFVKPGQKLDVKPNIGWEKVPELAGNTNPQLIAEIVKQCFAAGAKEVTVFDHTCDDWQKCYKNSGIEAAAKAAGAKERSCLDAFIVLQFALWVFCRMSLHAFQNQQGKRKKDIVTVPRKTNGVGAYSD